MKQIFIALIVLPLICLLVGCDANKQGKGDFESNVQLNLEETAYDLADAAQFETSYNADPTFLSKNFKFNEADATAYKVLFGTVQDANRLALFEVDNDTQRKAILKVVKSIHEQLENTFPEEMAEQKAQAKEAKTLEHGKYILFISGKNMQEGANAFEALFKEQPSSSKE